MCFSITKVHVFQSKKKWKRFAYLIGTVPKQPFVISVISVKVLFYPRTRENDYDNSQGQRQLVQEVIQPNWQDISLKTTAGVVK